MIQRLIFVIIGCHFATVIGIDESAHHGEWAYEGDTAPEFWYVDHPNCNGTRQSPINIIENETVFDPTLPSLNLFNYTVMFNNTNYYLTNNGHTVILGMNTNSTISAGIIWKGKQYNYYGLHFHWGDNDTTGSEHLLNDKHFPLEVHIVHYLNDYGNFTNSINYSDGILVWASLFQLDNSSNLVSNSLQNVFSYVQNVTHPGNITSVPPIALSSFVAENSLNSYYHYEGSLTTPECSESAMWIVNQKFMKVSPSQLKAFRLLKGHSHIVNNTEEDEILTRNDRPVQSLNGRKIYTSVNLAAVTSSPAPSSATSSSATSSTATSSTATSSPATSSTANSSSANSSPATSSSANSSSANSSSATSSPATSSSATSSSEPSLAAVAIFVFVLSSLVSLQFL